MGDPLFPKIKKNLLITLLGLRIQMINIKNSVEFGRLLKTLSDDIVDAHIHYQMYWELNQALNQHPLVVQQSNTFWTFTLQAQLNSSVYTLCRIYDKNDRSLHLYSWLSTIEKNLHLFDEGAFRERLKDNPHVDSLARSLTKPDETVLKQDILLCSTNDPLVKNLTTQRGSRIAHKNAKHIVAERDIGGEYPLTFSDVAKLLERASTILNRYSYLFGANVYSTQVVGHNDYKYIFKCVEEKVEVSQKEWRQQT